MLELSLGIKSSRTLAPLGFGCCPMGRHGWGAVEDAELFTAVQMAIDFGVQFFDTADVYGLGASETTLGRALQGRRKEAVVATKFGVRFENGKTFYDTSPEWIRKAVVGSLRRLKIDYIDLYQMHYWDGKTPMEEVLQVLEALRSEGKILAYGVTNHDPRDPAFARSACNLVSYSYQYSLVSRDHEPLVFAVQARPGPIFLAWGSLGQGLLSGKYTKLEQLDLSDRRRRDVYANFHGRRFCAVQDLLTSLRSIADSAGVPSLTQLALRWIVEKIPRSMPLVGIKRPAQIRDAAGVFNVKLGPLVIEQMDRLSQAFLANEGKYYDHQ